MERKHNIKMLQLFFENSPLATQVLFPTGKFAYVNPAFTKIWKLTITDLINQNIFDDKIINREDILPIVQSAFKGETVILPPIQITTAMSPDTKIWLRSNMYSILDDDGEIEFVVMMHQDVTSQKKDEEILKESREKFQSLYENSPLPYQSLNEDGTVKDVNPAWLRVLGYEKDEVIGKSFADFLHPDWKIHFEKNFPKFKRKGYVHDVQFNIRHKNGDYLNISYEGCVGYKNDGMFKQTYCVFQDVSDRLRAEKQLLEEKRKSNILISNLPGMAYRCINNRNWTMQFVSDGSKLLCGYNPEDLIENNVVSYGELIHPDDRERVWSTIQTSIDSNLHYELEYRVIARDKNEKWVWERGLCISCVGDKNQILEGFITDITDRKQAQLALKDNEVQLTTILETLPAYVWFKDEQGVYITCNKRFEQFYGASKDEIIGKTDYDFVPKELADFFRKKDSEALKAGGERTNEEYVTLASTGEVILLETTKKPVYDSKGELIGILGIGIDITQKKQAEKALMEGKEQLQSIFDDPNTFLGTLNLDGIMVNCNDTALEFIGKTLDDLSEIPFWDSPWWNHDQEQRDRLLACFEKAKIGKTCGFESYHYSKNNQIIYLTFSLRPILDSEGNVYRFLAEGQNITERKLIADAFKESEERYRRLTENAQDMIYRMSLPDGKYEYVSPASKRIYGYTPDEFYTTPTLIKNLMHPDWLDYFNEQWELLLADKMPPTYEYKIITPTGEERWIHQRNVMVRDAEGKPIAIEGIVTDITKGKLAEESIKRSEERYKEAQALGHVGSWEYNVRTGRFWGSDETKRIHGFSQDADDFTSEEVFSFVPERERVHQAFTDLIEKGTPFDHIFDIIRQDTGEKRTIHSIAVLEPDEKDNPLVITGVDIDITELKKSEEELKLNIKRFRQAQKLGHVGNWGYDLIANKFWGSEETKRIYGFSQDLQEIPPESVDACMLELDRVGVAFSDLIQFNKRYDIIFDIKALDTGAIKTLHAVAELERDDLGNPVKVMGSIHDITDLIKVQKEVTEINTRLKLATESANLGVWDYSIASDSLVWDDRVYEFYGITRDSFSKNFEGWSRCIHPDDLQSSIEAYEKALNETNEFNKVWRVIKPSGEVRHIEGHGVVIRDNENKPVRMTGINMDITDRIKAEDELDKHRMHLEELVSERTIELEEAMKEMESFSYSVSHDLRAPLRAITGFCSYLVEDYRDKLDDEGKRLLQIITDNAVRMDKLIIDILNLSRISRTEIKNVRTDMKKLVNGVYLSSVSDEEMKEFELILPNIPSALCDPSALKQVWSNLISNALKYSSKSETKKIEIGCLEKENELIYYIKDWGVGFNQNYETKLFGVFQRLHSAQDFSGTGVGLAIVQRLVKKHSGKIWAKGEEDKGATFFFSLPKKK